MCSGLEHMFGVERFIVLRQDKNACPRTGAQAFGHEIRSAAPAEHQIEQSDIRIFSRQQAERFGGRSGFAAHFKARRLLEHRPHPHAYNGVIVNDQDARHFPLVRTRSARTGIGITDSRAAHLSIAALHNQRLDVDRKTSANFSTNLQSSRVPTEISTPEGCTPR